MGFAAHVRVVGRAAIEVALAHVTVKLVASAFLALQVVGRYVLLVAGYKQQAPMLAKVAFAYTCTAAGTRQH